MGHLGPTAAGTSALLLLLLAPALQLPHLAGAADERQADRGAGGGSLQEEGSAHDFQHRWPQPAARREFVPKAKVAPARQALDGWFWDVKEGSEGPEAGEEEEFTKAEIGMAWMLLGGVAGVMALFYMVNWPDDDIRRYSWQIISSTISIFTAVLIYQGMHNFVMNFIPETSKKTAVCVNYFLFLVWFALLQACIAYLSGANCEAGPVNLDKEVWCFADALRADCGDQVAAERVRNRSGVKSVAVVNGVEVFVQKTKYVRERREHFMKAYATLFAHMTGFAAINAGGYLMHLDFFSQSWYHSCLSVVIMQVMLFGLFRGARAVRAFTSGLDGTKDERDHLFDEEVYEAENDISSLAMSFLTVQVVRFFISGTLPEVNGHDLDHADKAIGCILVLYLLGFLLGAAAVGQLLLAESGIVERYPILHRPLDVIQSQNANAFSWCIFWASQWLIASFDLLRFVGGSASMAGSIIIAGVLSVLAFWLINLLDKIGDHWKKTLGKSEHGTTRVLQCCINSMGILIGFSWEHCFEGGVAALASLTSKPEVVKISLASAVALVIVPAWRMYILTKVIAHQKYHIEDMNSLSPTRVPTRSSTYEPLSAKFDVE